MLERKLLQNGLEWARKGATCFAAFEIEAHRPIKIIIVILCIFPISDA